MAWTLIWAPLACCRHLGLTSGVTRSQLSLLSTLLLLLGLVRLSAGSNGGTGSALLLESFNRGTTNSTHRLDGLSGALLGNLLSDTLLVLSAVKNSPGDLSGVQSLVEKRSRLGGLESEDLRVISDEESASARQTLAPEKESISIFIVNLLSNQNLIRTSWRFYFKNNCQDQRIVRKQIINNPSGGIVECWCRGKILQWYTNQIRVRLFADSVKIYSIRNNEFTKEIYI